MDSNRVMELIESKKLIILLRKVPMEKIADTARALVRGGIELVEVTFDQLEEDPVGTYKKSIQLIREAVSDALCLGAGTVLNVEQVEAAYEAGAEYIISPNTDKDVIKRTKELNMISIPGAMTPTEIVHAWNCGADIVKLFPADDLGYHYIWNIRGPLPHIPLIATGGVNPKTIPEFLSYGIRAVGTGVTVIDREALAADDYDTIERLAKEHVNAVDNYTIN